MDEFEVFILGVITGMVLIAVIVIGFGTPIVYTGNALAEKACQDYFGQNYTGIISSGGNIECELADKEPQTYDDTDIIIREAK